MKTLITASLLCFLLGCNGDVSESRNHRLPLRSLATIPSPAQSLLPPTFENPIKDYTVGLVPPPVDSGASKTGNEPNHQHHQVQAPIHQHPTRFAPRLITPVETSRTRVQQRSGHSIGPSTGVHHQTHHSTNLVQPQVYQPKTAVYQQNQQPNTHHHHHYHQQQQQSNRYGTGFVVPQSAQQYSHHSVSPRQYYAPVTQSAVHQHSVHASVPLHRVPTVVEHVRPSVQQSTIVSRPVSSSGVRVIQTYPSVSYVATAPQLGSTLNLPNSRLEPELVYIISDVLGRYHF